jgi:uridylate kinase
VLADNLAVIDSTAASLCRDNHIPVYVFDLQSDPMNLYRAVQGENIGTLIKEDR